MAELTPSQLDGFAREVAGQVAEGYSHDQVLSNLDLASHELDQVYDSEEFQAYLESYGKPAVEAWKESRAASRTGSFHRKVSERFDTYYEELHTLAMNKGLKPEKRADILLTLMKYVAPPDQTASEPVRMPPDLIENWVRRNQEYEASKAKGLQAGSTDRVGPKKGNSAESEAESLLLRSDGHADAGPDSGTSPAFRELHPDEPLEWGSLGIPAEVGVDATRALQEFDHLSSLPAVDSVQRQEHIDRIDQLEREKHEGLARRNKEHDRVQQVLSVDLSGDKEG
jgi:hypothetical protein